MQIFNMPLQCNCCCYCYCCLCIVRAHIVDVISLCCSFVQLRHIGISIAVAILLLIRLVWRLIVKFITFT